MLRRLWYWLSGRVDPELPLRWVRRDGARAYMDYPLPRWWLLSGDRVVGWLHPYDYDHEVWFAVAKHGRVMRFFSTMNGRIIGHADEDAAKMMLMAEILR